MRVQNPQLHDPEYLDRTAPRRWTPTVIAVVGKGGLGKTTLTAALASNSVHVVKMDTAPLTHTGIQVLDQRTSRGNPRRRMDEVNRFIAKHCAEEFANWFVENHVLTRSEAVIVADGHTWFLDKNREALRNSLSVHGIRLWVMHREL